MSVFNLVNKARATALKYLYHKNKQAGVPRIQGHKKLMDKGQMILNKIYKVVWMLCDRRRYGS